MADSSSLHSWLETLPIKEIISHCKGSLTLSCAERSSKTHLIDRILNKCTPNDFVAYLVQKAKERWDEHEAGPLRKWRHQVKNADDGNRDGAVHQQATTEEETSS